jgi:hypothetical protein
MANKGEQYTGGRGGIRTHGTLAGTPVFKTGSLNHSDTLPVQEFQSLNVGRFRTQRELGPKLDPPGHFPRNPAANALISAEIELLAVLLRFRLA